MPDLYQVVFTGQLAPHVTADQAARDFAAVFKVPEDKAVRLITGGSAHVLKRDVDRPTAERYRQLLEEIGLVVGMEPMIGGAPAAPAMAPPPITESAPPPAGAAWTPPSAASRNPYAPPAADLTVPRAAAGDSALTGPHALSAGHGWTWITRGFDLFKQAPLPWIGAFLVYLLIIIVASLIPFVGGLLTNLFGPVLIAGFFYAADRQAHGDDFTVGNIFQGFSTRLGPLVGVGAIYLGALFLLTIVFVGIFMGVLGAGVAFDPDAGPEQAMAAMGPMGALLILVLVALVIPLAMAYWFAPALVMLSRMGAVEAMQTSFRGCWRNLLPLLVFGLVAMVLMIIGMLPLLLGLVVVAPVLFAANYFAYREIFFGDGLPARGY